MMERKHWAVALLVIAATIASVQAGQGKRGKGGGQAKVQGRSKSDIQKDIRVWGYYKTKTVSGANPAAY